MRIDIWDVEAAKSAPSVDCGYPRNFEALYELSSSEHLGSGGFGTVRVATERTTGTQFACKSIKKHLGVPNLSLEKQAQHIDNVKREVKVLRLLRGTLSVVNFKGVYEDDECIHIVMELCRGGELLHQIGQRHYSEALVSRASYRPLY